MKIYVKKYDEVKLHIKLERTFFLITDKQNKYELLDEDGFIQSNYLIDLKPIYSLFKDFFKFREVVPSYMSGITISDDRRNTSTTKINLLNE